jgi:hypothetical protein
MTVSIPQAHVAPVLDVDRPDLDLVAIELQDDAIVVVGLGMDDLSQIQVHPA